MPEVCRRPGISVGTFYAWRKKYVGVSPSELKHMRQPEEQNQRLKKLVADLSPDKAILQDVLAKKSRRQRAAASRQGDNRTRVHYGYRRVHVILKREDWRDNLLCAV